MNLHSSRATRRGWSLRVRLGFALVFAIVAGWMIPPEALACTGTPRPPRWGRSTVLGKGAPGVFVLAGPGGAAVIPTVVFIGATGPPGAPCTPVSTTVTLTLACVPPPPAPPGAVIGAAVAFPTPAPGVYLIPVPVVIPPGPVRLCALTGTAATTWASGAISVGAGDIEICIVDPAPGEPVGGNPRLDLELLTPEVQTAHPGDQRENRYRLTNNDPDESVTVTLVADSEQVSRLPGVGGVPEPPGSGSGVFAIADVGAGDNFPIAFTDDLVPDPAPGNNYALDDGTQETDAGTALGSVIWLNQFTTVAGQEVIDKVSIAYGTGANGRAVQILLYDDPNGDGDPSDGNLLTSRQAVAANEDTGIFNEYKIEPTFIGPAGTNFFVGAVMQEATGVFPGALDTGLGAGQSWYADNEECEADVEDLTFNDTPPTEIGDFGAPFNWMVRANGRAEVGFTPWVPLPPDPLGFPIPVLTREVTLCPGESIELGISTRSWPMCPPGSGCEQRVKLMGTFSGGDPALACAASTYMTDATVPPDFECPDGGMMTEVLPQGPDSLAFHGQMPTHDIEVGMVVENVQIFPEFMPPLLPLPLQTEVLEPTLGRFRQQMLGAKGPALQQGQFFESIFDIRLFSKLPEVELQLLDAHLMPVTAPEQDFLGIEIRGQMFGPDIPPTLDTFFTVFAHVTLDGITLVGPDDVFQKAQLPPGGASINVITPELVEMSLVGSVPFMPPLPPQMDVAQLKVDPLGIATGLLPPPPCPGDLDGDGIVGFPDLLIVLSMWGPCPGCPGDIDGDDIVGFPDLLIVLSTWGDCP
jgi:hypothetical protein